MDPERMLELCRKGQWDIDRDLDWSLEPEPMDREKEIAVVQYFTDMAGIERLAKALFELQRRRTDDPTMKKIFATFVADEERHAKVAERLARFYDVHRYRDYRLSPTLVAFRPHFLEAVEHVSAEIANGYITAGELILDVALLRSLNDYVDDAMSHAAMELINRDESRHIAVDFHMTEYYASPEYQAWIRRQPRRTRLQKLRARFVFAKVLYYAKPFGEDVFYGPMRRIDPTGRRLREAIKRMQLLGEKPQIADRPMARLMTRVRDIALHPVFGPLFGRVAERVAGAPAELLGVMYDADEARRFRAMSFDEMAEDALQAKFLH